MRDPESHAGVCPDFDACGTFVDSKFPKILRDDCNFGGSIKRRLYVTLQTYRQYIYVQTGVRGGAQSIRLFRPAAARWPGCSAPLCSFRTIIVFNITPPSIDSCCVSDILSSVVASILVNNISPNRKPCCCCCLRRFHLQIEKEQSTNEYDYTSLLFIWIIP